MLANLALEPFLSRICQNIQGFQSPTTNVKLAAYADDILLFISKPDESIPAFLEEVKSFSLISGYKLNADKCENLPLTKYTYKVDFAPTNFVWKPSHIKYLGLEFTPTIKGTITRCMNNCIQKISDLTAKWHPLHLSWWGRLDTIKMMLSPIILYTISNIPASIPTKFFHSINVLLSSFLWAKKKPHMSILRLTRPKAVGGVNFPNFPTYHRAFLLRQTSY